METDIDSINKARISYVAQYDKLHTPLSELLKEELSSIDPSFRPSRIKDVTTATLQAAMPGFRNDYDFVLPEDIYCAANGIRKLDNWWKLSENQQRFYRTAAECLTRLHAHLKISNLFDIYDATVNDVLSKVGCDHVPHGRAALRAILWNQEKTPEQLAKETHEITKAYGISSEDYVFDESQPKASMCMRVISEDTRRAYRELVGAVLETTLRHGMVSYSDFHRRGFVLPTRAPAADVTAKPTNSKPGL